METLFPKSQLMMVELYIPTGTIKSLKPKHIFSKLPIRFNPKKVQFFTNSGLKESEIKILLQLSLELPFRTKISIS